MIKDQDSDLLIELLGVSQNERLARIRQLFVEHSKDEVLSVLNAFIEISSQFSNACLDAVNVHLAIEGDYIYTDRLNMPSLVGALKGAKLLKHIDDPTKVCKGCAYRIGTMANCSEVTLPEVEICLADGFVFFCHENINEHDIDHKSLKACKGYAQHIRGLKHEKSIPQ
ncbi:hypothetical protein [Acinetobacter sp.]|uniref:hypothetical protein n=1 Tax=Acinetobacter sp. TaxID=472 RepID=UPI0028AE2786|nr:hypothetical protein [Acinetobacter sp.]